MNNEEYLNELLKSIEAVNEQKKAAYYADHLKPLIEAQELGHVVDPGLLREEMRKYQDFTNRLDRIRDETIASIKKGIGVDIKPDKTIDKAVDLNGDLSSVRMKGAAAALQGVGIAEAGISMAAKGMTAQGSDPAEQNFNRTLQIVSAAADSIAKTSKSLIKDIERKM